MKKLLLCLSCVLCFVNGKINSAFAQGEANIWCFGNNCGLDFNSGSPVAFAGVAMTTTEGSSSIADAAGNLLFYSDGTYVWDRTHTQMPNGFGLFGGGSSTQAAFIVKQPGNTNIYFIFTAEQAQGPNGSCYSIIDMNLNGGLGDVTTKNFPLWTPSAEKVCGHKHANGVDVWVLGHEIGSDAFFAYLLTSAGVSAVPVVSNTGLVHTTGGGVEIGYMKISPDGTHLALATRYLYTNQLFNFDCNTGIVSNPIGIASSNGSQTYGIEFSPDNTKLYTTDYGQISQFDITSNDSATIESTRYNVGPDTWALQLGPDLKIYSANYTVASVNVINDPNVSGAGCNYVANAVALTGTCTLGLPNFLTYSMQVPPTVNFIASDRHICPGTCINFTNLSTGATSWQWYFPGGTPDSSTDFNPSFICYDTPGNYSVTLIATNAFGADTVTLNNLIQVYPQPVTPTITQIGDTLFSNTGYSTYQWFYGSDSISGATNSFYVATLSGNYNLAVADDNGCIVGVGILNVIASLTPALSKGEGVSVFPNPAHDKLYVTGNTLCEDEILFEFYNSLGEKVCSTQFTIRDSPFAIATSDFSSGIYLLKITAGEKIFTEKVMIDK